MEKGIIKSQLEPLHIKLHFFLYNKQRRYKYERVKKESHF